MSNTVALRNTTMHLTNKQHYEQLLIISEWDTEINIWKPLWIYRNTHCSIKYPPFISSIPPEINFLLVEIFGDIFFYLKWHVQIINIIHQANTSILLLKLVNPPFLSPFPPFHPPFPFFKGLYLLCLPLYRICFFCLAPCSFSGRIK